MHFSGFLCCRLTARGTQWTYGTHQGCRHGWGLACYFEPHAAQCPHLFSREPDDTTVTRMLREEEPHWMWEHRDSVSGAGQCSHYRPMVADNPAWSFRQQGLLWWRSHILSFLMNPNAVLQRRVRHVKNLIGYTHPIIGLHIRHGDACTHASLSNYRPGCKSVADYFAEVLAFLPRFAPCFPRAARACANKGWRRRIRRRHVAGRFP